MATKTVVGEWNTVKNTGYKRHAPGTKARQKQKKRQKQIIPILCGSSNGKTISFKKLKQKTENEIEQMQHSSLLRVSWTIFKLIASSNHSSFCRHRGIESVYPIKVNIICLGLGSFGNSLSSMQQISFLCALMKQFDKNFFVLNKVELFEPILTEIEKKILSEFGICVLCEDKMGKYALNEVDDNVISLCFMPHCPRILYDNLLKTNWFNLSKMYIIGNSFDQYLQLSASNSDKSSWIATTKQLKVIKEISVNIDDTQSQKYHLEQERVSVSMNAFAFQTIMYFPVQRLLKISPSEWNKIYNQLSINKSETATV